MAVGRRASHSVSCCLASSSFSARVPSRLPSSPTQWRPRRQVDPLAGSLRSRLVLPEATRESAHAGPLASARLATLGAPWLWTRHRALPPSPRALLVASSHRDASHLGCDWSRDCHLNSSHSQRHQFQRRPHLEVLDLELHLISGPSSSHSTFDAQVTRLGWFHGSQCPPGTLLARARTEAQEHAG